MSERLSVLKGALFSYRSGLDDVGRSGHRLQEGIRSDTYE